MLETIIRRLKRDKRGVSNVIVVMLSLVLIVIIVGNVVLWSYQMNQLDWEKMHENIDVIDAEPIIENWTQNPSEYTLKGSTSWVSGDISNLVTDDSVYMTFRSYYSGTDTSDFVDNNISNVDSSADKGTHSNFAAQQAGPDLINDTLTEEAGGMVWLWQESTSGYSATSSWQTYEFWSSLTTNSTTSGTVTTIGIYVFASPGNSPQVKLGIYDDSGGSPGNLIGETNAATITGVGWLDLDIIGGGVSISPSTTYHVAHITNIAPTTQWRYYKIASPVSCYRNNRVWPNLFDPAGTTSTSSSYRYGAYRLGYHSNYALDLEVQWTGVDYNEVNEELCIYGGTMGSEDIRVDAWNGTAWQNLFTDLTSGWNNVSVSSYLGSSTVTIRFKDGNESGDTTRDSWNIDATLLHVWSDEYTSEVEFTGLSNTEEWSQLTWMVNTAWTVGSVNITLQLYNYTLDGYPTSGNGYIAYVSDATPNTDENKSQTINVNPTDFRNATGYWKIKIKGTKAGSTQFDFKADCIELKTVRNSGTFFTFKNEGSLTSHLVAIWVNNSTHHQRYEINVFVDSGETITYICSYITLPDEPYKVKVVSERGNIAVFTSS